MTGVHFTGIGPQSWHDSFCPDALLASTLVCRMETAHLVGGPVVSVGTSEVAANGRNDGSEHESWPFGMDADFCTSLSLAHVVFPSPPKKI